MLLRQLQPEAILKNVALKLKSNRYTAFYSSIYDGIVTEPELMTVPFDDHMVHRGHGVLNKIKIIDGQMYHLDLHLRQLQNNAKSVQINLPFSGDRIQQIWLQLAAFSKLRNAELQYWLSAGPGDLAVFTDNVKPQFYAGIYPSQNESELQGISATTHKKNYSLLPSIKSTNYISNAIIANQSRSKGGYIGVMTKNGKVLESPIANIAFIYKTQDGIIYKTPPLDGSILPGTSRRNYLGMAQHLLQQKVFSKVEECEIDIEDAYQASEIIISCNIKIYPVLKLDGKTIGDGKPGEIYNLFKNMRKEWTEKFGSYEAINYALYP